MKFQCAIEAQAFDGYLEKRLAEQNERVKNPAYQYVRIPTPEDPALVAIRIYRAKDYDLVAVGTRSEEDGYLMLDFHLEDIPRLADASPLEETEPVEKTELAETDAVGETESDEETDTAETDTAETDTAETAETEDTADTSLAAKIAANLTVMLFVGAFLYFSVWGITYLIGNRNAWLPLIAPVCFWVFRVLELVMRYRPRDTHAAFLAFLETDLACIPCPVDEDDDATTEASETETDDEKADDTEAAEPPSESNRPNEEN